MGQAKLRGSKEQRIEQAKAKQRERLGFVEKSMKDIYQEFDLPQDAVPMGYVINIVDSDEYLAFFEDSEDRTDFGYTPRPELAKIFEDVDEAIPVAQRVAEKYKTDICFLFDTENQYRVFSLTTI